MLFQVPCGLLFQGVFSSITSLGASTNSPLRPRGRSRVDGLFWPRLGGLPDDPAGRGLLRRTSRRHVRVIWWYRHGNGLYWDPVVSNSSKECDMCVCVLYFFCVRSFLLIQGGEIIS